MEDWAEILRSHRTDGVSISEIARRMGLARNTVRAALRSERPPKYVRAPRETLADGVEPAARALLGEFPRMPATVIAERIGWAHSMTTLKDRIRQIRPEYLGVDPVDRVVYEPGAITHCDLWFPDTKIPVAPGQVRVLPVLVMAHPGLLPLPVGDDAPVASDRGPAFGDVAAHRPGQAGVEGACLGPAGWDRRHRTTDGGRRGVRWDPRVEDRASPTARSGVQGDRRARQRLLGDLVPARASLHVPGGLFNTQISEWLTHRANQRTVRAIGGRPVDVLETDYAAMTPLPPMDPAVGLSNRVRLARDYFVRVDANDYSVDPHFIGRFVDVTASPTAVVVFCNGQVIARHRRSWARHDVVRDQVHVDAAAELRRDRRQRRDRAQRAHADGHTVVLRALPDYDALFGINPDDFTAAPRTPPAASNSEATS